MNVDRPIEPAPIVRIDALTGLRILPALAVLMSHLDTPPAAGPVLTSFMAGGYGGVTIFFVLSGFVLAHNYFDRFAQQFSPRLLRSYLVARVARVYPLYLLMLVWVTLPRLAGGNFRGTLWVQHAFALQAWLPALKDVFAFNSLGWSISVEFFLYACFPVLVALLLPFVRTYRSTLLALAVVVLGMAALTGYFVLQGYEDLPLEDPNCAHRWLYRHPLSRLGDFSLGMLTARLVALRGGVTPRGNRLLLGFAVLSLVLLMCWPAHRLSAWSWDFSYALPGTLLIFALASNPSAATARLLSTKPMLLLGEASYAFYLCHISMLRHLTPLRMPDDTWYLTKTATILMIIVLAVGLHVAIERPGRILLRWLLDPAARRQREAPAPAAQLSQQPVS
jgi:peptidoglycan/LPS O-acetylase OafA/YrhL